MLDLVSMISDAMVFIATDIDGNIKCFHVSIPVAGSQSSLTENSSINISPIQNAGMDVSSMAVIMLTESIMEYCLTAEMMPTETPTMAESAVPSKASLSVVGNRLTTSLLTGSFVT